MSFIEPGSGTLLCDVCGLPIEGEDCSITVFPHHAFIVAIAVADAEPSVTDLDEGSWGVCDDCLCFMLAKNKPKLAERVMNDDSDPFTRAFIIEFYGALLNHLSGPPERLSIAEVNARWPDR